VGVEHQFLGLAEVDAHERHAAVRQLHVRRLDRQRKAMERDCFVTPVELVGLSRRKAHRHIGARRNPRVFGAPGLYETMNAIVGAVITATTQFLEQTLRRAALPPRQGVFLLQDLRQNLDPDAQLRRRLDATLVFELGLVSPDDFAHCRARYRQRADDLLDRAVLLKIGTPYLADLVHANHPRQPFPADQGQRKGR